MKLLKLYSILIVIVLLTASCSMMKKSSGDGLVSISEILADAKSPLSNDQQEKLKAFSTSGGREAFMGIYNIFDEKQTDALKEAFGVSAGRDGGPERPRFLFFAVILENSGCPLSEEQIVKWKALPDGRGGFQQMREVLTEEQNGVFQGMFNR